MRKLTATTSLVLISALVLTGCASESNSSSEQIETQSSSDANLDGAAVDETKSIQSEAAPEFDVTPPSGVTEGTDAFIVWEALMGSDGEYAALASYQAVLDEYGVVEPYATIMAAEGRHADALIRQLQRLGVEVPSNPYLGLIAAPGDLEAAAEAWAEGEILNVEMYDNLLSQTEDSQIVKVLNNLRSASLDSHLPAFQLAAENGGLLTEDQMNSNQTK